MARPEQAATQTNKPVDFEMLIDNNMENMSREFNVTVAVEEFNDDIVALTDENSSKDKRNTPLILNRDEILKETNKILSYSNYVADKLLSIEVKNSVGFFPQYTPTDFEIKLQTVFEQWNELQHLINVKYRSSPLSYKCYMCKKSWWYLNDFREHLKKHKYFKLKLEKYTLFEVNIIAYFKENIVEVKDFYNEGECPKCGDEFGIHKSTNRIEDCYYQCKVVRCDKKFPTCYALKEHEHASHSHYELTGSTFSSREWKKACEVCLTVFTWNDYHSHMKLMHSVRSDMLLTFEYNKCSHCQANYVCEWMHKCLKIMSMEKCSYCFRLIIDKSMHFNKNLGCICKVCTTVLPKQCMEVEHLMSHTNKFLKVQKCMFCDEFEVFLDNVTAMNHAVNEHNELTKENRNCFYTIIIPKSCIHGESREIQTGPVAHITVKEEPTDWSLPSPEIRIKEEIIDDCITNTVYKDQEIAQIKEEYVFEDNPEDPETYSGEIENNYDNDAEKIFGIKIEHIVKEEPDSEYEDDIIILDFNQPDLQDSEQQSLQESHDSLQLFEQDSDDITERKYRSRNSKKPPKIYKCHQCGFEASHRIFKEHLPHHLPKFLDEIKTFKCTKCNNTYNSFNKYVSHFVKHNLELLACPSCFRKFQTYEKFAMHILIHIRKSFQMINMYTVSNKCPIYKCITCIEKVEIKNFFEHWEKHLSFTVVKEVKEQERQIEEPVTGSVDDDILKQLLKRLQQPEPRKAPNQGCIICNKHFNRRNDCKRHIIGHLLNDAFSKFNEYDGLRCQICGFCSKKHEIYKKHMRDHGYLPIYECVSCDKSFSDSSNFAKHKKIHNTNAYTCDTCGRKFQAKVSIEKHVKIHESQTPIVCEPCGKVFYFRATYKKHYKMHEKHLNRFRCNMCTQVFNSLKAKWDHQWLVHKQRSQKADCPICGESFRKFADLKNHVKAKHNTNLKRTSKSRSNKEDVVKALKHTRMARKVDSIETLVIYD